MTFEDFEKQFGFPIEVYIQGMKEQRNLLEDEFRKLRDDGIITQQYFSEVCMKYHEINFRLFPDLMKIFKWE